MFAFGGTRTFHRLMVAIEDAGWELRDTLAWIYGGGFPKSHNISKAIDEMLGVERPVVAQQTRMQAPSGIVSAGRPSTQIVRNITAAASPEAQLWDGWGTALKPSWEPIVLAMRSFEGTYATNALANGVAGINVAGGKVGDEVIETCGRGDRSGRTSITPRSPDYEGNAHTGRWPANLVHDGSEEVVSLFPAEAGGGSETGYDLEPSVTDNPVPITRNIKSGVHYGDSGSAARFFYCAKASREDRDSGCEDLPERARQTMGSGIGGQPDQDRENNKNIHPTVKPVELMKWLCTLARMPKRNLIIDPFMGSGSTGVACAKLGIPFIGIELNPEYFEIAKRRIEHAHKQMGIVESFPDVPVVGKGGQYKFF